MAPLVAEIEWIRLTYLAPLDVPSEHLLAVVWAGGTPGLRIGTLAFAKDPRSGRRSPSRCTGSLRSVSEGIEGSSCVQARRPT